MTTTKTAHSGWRSRLHIAVVITILAVTAILAGLPATTPASAAPNCNVPDPPPICDEEPGAHLSPTGTVAAPTRLPGYTQVRVTGRATDPDAPGTVTVKIYSNNVYRGSFQTSASGSYSGDIQVGAGHQVVCVIGVNRNVGQDATIGCRPVEVGVNPYGYLDAATPGPAGIHITGWSIDPDTANPITVHVYINSAGRAITANTSRPDVAAAYPGYGAAHGFDLTIPAAKGQYTVCAYGINTGPGVNDSSGDMNTDLGCKTVDQGGPPDAPRIKVRSRNVTGPVVNIEVGPRGVTAVSELFRRRPPSTSLTSLKSRAGSSSWTWEDRAVSASERLCYFVRSTNPYGSSRSSESCTTVPLPALPQPTGLSATTTRTTAKVSWTDASNGEDSFRISSTKGTTSVPAAAGTGARLKHTVTGLSAGKEYCFTITAVKTGHDSNPARICATTKTPPPPPPPPPPPTPPGIKTLRVWNCETHGYNGGLWMWDHTLNDQWRRVSDAPNGGISTCGGFNPPSASVNLPNGHIVRYQLLVVNGSSCRVEDPTNYACVRGYTFAMRGDTNGIVQNWVS